jgi:hypothetical protein
LLRSQNTVLAPIVQVKDSTFEKDSLRFYRKLHDFAVRRQITYLIYSSIFRDPPAPVTPNTPAKPICLPGDNYVRYQSKPITSIRIVTVDPLGKSVNDTTLLPGNFVERAGNSLHVKTKISTVNNLLLFKSGEPFDSLKVIESERIIRIAPGIREVKISVLVNGNKCDSLAILVVVRDLWSVSGDGQATPFVNSLKLGDNNFLGLSHTIQNRVTYDLNIPNSFVTTGNYQILNFGHTFISGNVFYTYSQVNKTIGLTLDRPFISPLTKWAGGISNVFIYGFASYQKGTLTQNEALDFHLHDTWLGRSFKLRKRKFNAYKDPRIILAARLFDTQYLQRPSFKYDTLHKYQNSLLYMGSVGFCTRSYYKDINIYRFGRVEDVPEGRLLAFIGGYQKGEFGDMLYYGIRLAAGNHVTKLGYLSEKIEYGTFLSNGYSHKGVINLEFNYLSDRLVFNKWSVREFLNLKTTAGIRRDASETISINDPNGLIGYNSPVPVGTRKTVLNLSTVIYMPYKVVGFQFAALIFAGFGKMAASPVQISPSPVYQTYGIGVLIRNENLILSTIQLSLNYFPIMPGTHPDSFQFSPSTISNVKFTDFFLSKPDFVSYQ